MVPSTPCAAAAFAAFELLAPSPAPLQQAAGIDALAGRVNTQVESIQDVSALDFGDMFVADEPLLSDDDAPSLASADNSFAPAKAMNKPHNIVSLSAGQAPAVQTRAPAPSPSPVQSQRASSVALEADLSPAHRKSSLAPLPVLPPTQVPALSKIEALPSISSPATLTVRRTASKKRPRASLSRPAHILPESHPAHPRSRLTFATAPETNLQEIESISCSSGAKDEGKKESAPVTRLRQARRSSIAPASRPQTTTTAPLSPKVAPILIIEDEFSLHELEANDETFENLNEINFGDLSLPLAGELARSTSTPARALTSSISATGTFKISQLSMGGSEEPFNTRRRTTVAFALPSPPQQSIERHLDRSKHECDSTASQPMQPATLKRRASRAFEPSDKENAPTEQPHKPFVIKKASSLGQSRTDRRNSFAPRARAAQRVEHLTTPLLTLSGTHDDAPLTIIHLTPRVDPPPDDSQRLTKITTIRTNVAPGKQKGGLTLPRDFAFRSHHETRELERKRRAVERERDMAQTPFVEPTEVVHVKPATKAVPFNFSTTSRKAYHREADEVNECEPGKRLHPHLDRPNPKALGKQPLKAGLSLASKSITKSTLDLSSSKTISGTVASAPEWVSRTEQRQRERQDWSRRQREREEARQQSLQTEIKVKQEQERNKLQALRASLRDLPASKATSPGPAGALGASCMDTGTHDSPRSVTDASGRAIKDNQARASASRPALSPRTSQSSLSSTSSSLSPPSLGASGLVGSATQAGSRPYPSPGLIRRVSSGNYSSSPLSSSSRRGRHRQDSISSTLSSTDATSFEDSEDDKLPDKLTPPTHAGSGMSTSALLADADPGPATSTGPSGLTASAPSRRTSTGIPLANAHHSQSSSEQSASTSSAATGFATNPLPISISNNGAPSSVRLSTTPLFPSPLAQASGPEEDADNAKGDDGDGESEDDEDEEEELVNTWAGRTRTGSSNLGAAGSPLAKEASLPLFGEPDMSPLAQTVSLPTIESAGDSPEHSSATPRARERASDRRSPAPRDSSPEVDSAKTARAARVRSISSRSGSFVGSSSSQEESPSSRRRSRGDAFGSLSLETNRTGLASSPRNSVIMPSSASSSPSSPAMSAAANSLSRRASINLVSPPRPFAPGSPGLSRNSRTSLSGQLSSPALSPFPAAPPPAEAIKLQKVPESVRTALELRPSMPVSSDAGDASGLNATFSGISATSTGEIRVPKTPSATRAPSPASGSASPSMHSGNRSQSTSQASSRGPSRAGSRPVSRTSSRENLAGSTSQSPPATAVPGSSLAHSSASPAFSPMFSFQSGRLAGPSVTPGNRSRSKSVFTSPSSDPFSMSSGSSADLGVSPLSLGLSPLAEASAVDPASFSQHRRTTSQRDPTRGAGRLSSHRMSIAPGENLLSASVGSSHGIGGNHSRRTEDDTTKEYAQFLLETREAKMRKWRTSALAAEGKTPGGHARSSSWGGADLVRGGSSSSSKPPLETDITAAEGVGFGIGIGSKEFEWVDWMDEYNKMKEAKLRAEREARGDVTEDTEGELSQSASAVVTESTKGERFGAHCYRSLWLISFSHAASEYNPFEATAATMNLGGGDAFLTPNLPSQQANQYFPLGGLSTSSSSSAFQPKPTSAPTTSVPYEPLSRTTSRLSTTTGSPGVKKRRNFNKLGHKIDAWWSAVRSSFSATPEEELRHRAQGRRTSVDHSVPTSELVPIISRPSGTFVRPTTPKRPSLRNVSSAQDLKSRPTTADAEADKAQSQADTSRSRFVPAGALAPGARVVSTGRLAPPKQTLSSSGSDPESEGGTARSDSRKRNPGLSLNLGPSFNALVPPKRNSSLPSATTSHSSSSNSGSGRQSSSLGGHFFSPPLPTSTMATPSEPVRIQPRADTSTLPEPAPWDQTPYIVPTSTAFPVRSVPASSGSKDAKEPKNAPNFSMHTVRQQIRFRLVSAKEVCDKELRKIVHGISAYVEAELHHELATPGLPAAPFEEGQFGEMAIEDPLAPAPTTFEMDSESEALADVDQEENAGYTDSDGATSRPQSRVKGPLLSTGTPSSASSGTRRPSVTTTQRARSPRRASLAPRKRHLTSAPRNPDFSGYSLTDSRQKSRAGSATSSRSNSRSRSPMPPQLRTVSTGSRSPGHSSQSAAAGNANLAQSAFIVLLQEIITVATEILDTPVTKLTNQPGTCAEFINRVQQIGKAWEDNPELPCRGWYVQLLLAVAGLSRVIEWWEAEKGFWSFEDADDADAEPILFVAKAATGNEDKAPGSELQRGRGDSQSSYVEPMSLPAPSKWSPLGIDLGVPAPEQMREDATTIVDQARPERPGAPEGRTSQEFADQRAADLRQTVDEIRSSTLLMELSLDGQLFQFLSSAWEELTGLIPSECIDLPISEFVYPDDAAVFAEATRQLEADDSHTVEVSFRLRVGATSQSSQDEEPPDDLYEAMEGKGMLMLDGLTGRPSHTMWVIRPAPLSPDMAAQQDEALARYGIDTRPRRAASDPTVPLPTKPFSLETVLCRICERPTPVWFFEKHNETCNETHRLEGDISECNDRLKELASTIDEISMAIEDFEGADQPPEYRGIPLKVSPDAPTPPNYLENLKPPLSPKPQGHQVKKNQHRVLDLLHDILQTAESISTPAVHDDTVDVPIQEQRLLSPNSESNLAVVMRWQRPTVEEAALNRLVADVDDQIRFKLNSVIRLRNTILYAEKVRQEWEQKASEALANAAQEQQQEQQVTTDWRDQSPFESPALQPVPSHDESPQAIDLLDLPRPAAAVRRPSSNVLGLLSPSLSPDEGIASSVGSPPAASLLLSPRIPSGVPTKNKGSSIKDFKILKPISKGAFGSVYLAKKITTGDYYAIKQLKKSDMVAKNQVTNVKAERMILMTQTDSNFVVKLYYTFQSKDYLYLVMEYLNGGDCAALVKNLGELPEDWARRYIAEVINGLEYLHASGIVHRDLKPDNLLIDSKGHLKLTDFGLSRIGLLGRQTQMPLTRDRWRANSNSKDSAVSNTSSPSSTPANALGASIGPSYFGNVTDSFSLDTPSSESGSHTRAKPTPSLSEMKLALTERAKTDKNAKGKDVSEAAPRKFVGTPDYLAPESILGVGTDACVDWWALGVICYEFLYGFPPFHDETPEKVFENILSRRIQWHEDLVDYSPEARDFMEKLLATDPSKRLGAKGAAEVKSHSWLKGIDWANLLDGEVDFVPQVSDPENTEYFDPRGATESMFADDDIADEELKIQPAPTPNKARQSPMRVVSQSATGSIGRRARRERSETEPSPQADFGAFTFRNLTVLKQANDDVIRKMRDEQLLPPISHALDSPSMQARALPSWAKGKPRTGSVDMRAFMPPSPSSPSSASNSSNPSRQTAPSSPYSAHSRRQSEVPIALERFKARGPAVATMEQPGRRSSVPARTRSLSMSERERPAKDSWAPHERRRTSAQSMSPSPEQVRVPLPPLSIPGAKPRADSESSNSSMMQPASAPVPAPLASSSVGSAPSSSVPASSGLSTLDVLIAGRNPIVTRMLETIMQRLGARVVCLNDGGEALLVAQGVAFDLVLSDLTLPTISGESMARMIKSTKGPSQHAKIVAMCSHSSAIDASRSLFDGILPKPVLRDDLLDLLRDLGFVLADKTKVGDRRGSGEDRRGSGDAASVLDGGMIAGVTRSDPDSSAVTFMLYLVGLGLSDEKDVTVRGLEAIKRSERVYLEAYTSILGVGKDRLEAFYGKQVIVADREKVELEADDILRDADKVDVSFLVVGDPFGATTHADLLLRADALSIPYTVIHNASIMNAVGALGLALYNYGQTVSIPFFTDTWRPDSWLARVRDNSRLGLHTLCLLDIKVKEQSEENMARGRKIYEPPRYMSVPTAISQLLSVLDDEGSDERSSEKAASPAAEQLDPSTTLAISCSRIGDPSQVFVAGTLEELSKLDEEKFGPPLHSFVIVGRTFHALERDFARRWAVNVENWNRIAKDVYGVRD
ncbi:rim15, signal transduction response regulator [Microbotryomycetes sp. JL201]|nr:rim15, signal transduction response regulator [Microbotryomycetes sp. JL201]